MEKMTILDNDLAIASIIKGAPITGMPFEFEKNALDAKATKLHITSRRFNKADKAIFIDNGVGMDEDTIKSLSGLFGKPIVENGKTKKNFNTGARAMTIMANQLGVIFVSKHDGVIRSIKIGLYNGKFMANYDVEQYHIDFGKRYGFKDTWTAVILLGNSSEQNTFQKPYGNTMISPFKQQLFDRTYNKRLDIYIDGRLLPVASEIHNKCKKWVVAPRGLGFKINYIIGQSPILGLLHDGELFDVSKYGGKTPYHNDGTYYYGSMGAYAVKGELSVIIEFDSNYPVIQTHYRDSLKNKDTNDPIILNDFMKHITTKMPKELVDYIEEKANKEDSLKLRNKTAELSRDFMKKMGIPLEKLSPNKNGDATVLNEQRENGGTNGTKKAKNKGDNHHNPSHGEPKPAKITRGLTQLTAEWSDGEYDYEKYEVGYVAGKAKAYFNKSNILFEEVVERVHSRKGGSNIQRNSITKAFRDRIAESYGLALAFDLPEEHTGAVMLNNAIMLLATNDFVDSFMEAYKKQG